MVTLTNSTIIALCALFISLYALFHSLLWSILLIIIVIILLCLYAMYRILVKKDTNIYL